MGHQIVFNRRVMSSGCLKFQHRNLNVVLCLFERRNIDHAIIAVLRRFIEVINCRLIKVTSLVTTVIASDPALLTLLPCPACLSEG